VIPKKVIPIKKIFVVIPTFCDYNEHLRSYFLHAMNKLYEKEIHVFMVFIRPNFFLINSTCFTIPLSIF